MKDNPQLQQDDLPIWLALKYKFERLHMVATPCRPSAVRPKDQDDPHDDAHLKGENNAKSELGPSTSVSQELVDEISQTVDEAKLLKVVEEMLIQQCTSGDEHQYHIDQMQNFLKSDIVWESGKEIIVPPLVNQDLLYLKKGNSGPEKIVLSLHKFPVVIFPDDDIEERTSRWVTRFFIGSTVIWEKVNDLQLGVESYQQHVNLTAPTITFTGIKKYEMFSIVTDLVYGIIYENSKKEKRVMRHQEIHKFYNSTLKRVLEGLKSYNNDVKYGYVTSNLSKEDAEYLQLFAEEIEERLKHRDQMRRWEMYMNGRPLGSRRECPE
ncbi:hypothetical protein Tco_0913599 [Tanacetum coccineum]